MKILKYSLFILSLTFTGLGCQDFLEVNTNPNVPQEAPAHALLPSMIQKTASSVQFDARFIGKYVQNFVDALLNNQWDQHGYQAGSDNGGEVWRNHYWGIGRNVDLMIKDARSRNLPFYIGIGHILRAWGWQAVADCQGDAILKQAWEPNRNTFDFDSQEEIYKESTRLIDSALFYLDLKGETDPNFATADQFFGGNIDRWKRFAYGIKARTLHRLTNKSNYDAAAVIAACDASLTANADNATVPYLGNTSDDANFFGTLRSNMTGFRISQFIVGLLDGTNPTMLGARDPRLRFMLPQNSATDTVVRGGEPALSTTALNVWGYTINPSTVNVRGRYLFVDAARFPIMTYSEIQFIKAEAALRKGDKPLALAAFRNAVGAHVDFANTYVGISGSTTSVALTAIQKTALTTDTRLVPSVADSLTMSRIMLQKYIALWGWGYIETWNDLRRFHYGVDLFDGKPVYTNFKLPTTLFVGSGNKPAYRIRPRYNSEYIWNRAALDKIGGNNVDYQTYEMWNTKP
jgi:Starch-binding associating with outer membrane